MQCKEWDDANSELFKESHDEAMHKNSYKSRLYELISASQGAKAVVGAFKKLGAGLYKTGLVGWWVGLYSRRGLPLRGRGAYGPVLTHGPRVVAADAAGAEALVGW